MCSRAQWRWPHAGRPLPASRRLWTLGTVSRMCPDDWDRDPQCRALDAPRGTTRTQETGRAWTEGRISRVWSRHARCRTARGLSSRTVPAPAPGERSGSHIGRARVPIHGREHRPEGSYRAGSCREPPALRPDRHSTSASMDNGSAVSRAVCPATAL